jgi:hypothetical protein
MKISMNARPFYVALILASLHTIAYAQIFKCRSASGHYVFQDTPCAAPGNTQAHQRPRPGDRDESFTQTTKGYDAGANWEPRRQIDSMTQSSPAPQAAHTQTNTARPPAAASSRKSWQEKEQEYQQRRVEQQAKETKAYNDKAKAFNQMQRCNYARQQLGVIEDGRRAYSLDNNGDRHYVADEDRQAKAAEARQRVAEACK